MKKFKMIWKNFAVLFKIMKKRKLKLMIKFKN